MIHKLKMFAYAVLLSCASIGTDTALAPKLPTLVDLKPHLQASEQIATTIVQREKETLHVADLKPHLAPALLTA